MKQCMERGIHGAETLGAELVGPKGALAVLMFRTALKQIGAGGGLVLSNLTNMRLSGPGSLAGFLPSLVKDG